MEEKRNYTENGRGRRDYDKDFANFCLHCDMRREVETKVSWKHFVFIFGGALTIIALALTIGGSLAATGWQDYSTSMQTSIRNIRNGTNELVRTTERIETKQEFILRELELDKPKRHGETDRKR